MPDPSSGIEVLQVGEFIRSWLTELGCPISVREVVRFHPWRLGKDFKAKFN